MGATPQMNASQLNGLARAAIKARAVKMLQAIFQQTFTPTAGQNVSQLAPVITINPRNVGLIIGFWVKVTGTLNNGSAVQVNLTDFGPANVLSQIQFQDLNNNTRIQTPGWHIAILNSIKARRPFAGAWKNSSSDDPINFGSNFTGIVAPATIAAAGSPTFTMWYYVPLAYSENDFRGAVYANVVNATMQLQLTPNPTPVVQTATDSTLAMYVGAAAGSTAAAVISSLTVTVYQEYLDQLPAGKGGVLLPLLDLATIYEMKATSFTGITAGQDFPMQYSNFRDFLSTTLIYNNNPANNSGRTGGTDLNYLSLQAANMTNIWKVEPALAAIKLRNHLNTDLPPGCYYFGSREKPISTTQYGNQQLIVNPITANAGAYALVGYEDFAMVQTLSQAGSLAAS